MKRHTWIITGTSCLLAAALLGSLPGTVTADDRAEEGAKSTREAGQAPATNEEKASDRDRPDQSRNDGREEQNGRAVLGVFVGPSPTTGARIQRVEPQGAAAQAGLRPGDFILSINGSKIGRPEDVQQAVAGLEPGGEAKITLWRNGQTQELTVMLGERRAAGFRGTESSGAGGDRQPEGRGGAAGWLGMTLGDTAEGNGVRIQGVASDGPAARAGLRAGDVIRGIDSDDVSRAGDLMNALREFSPGDTVWFSIVRGEEEHAVKVTMADRAQLSGSAGTRELRGSREAGASGWLGMALAETDDAGGIRIQSVIPGGPAARAELRAGDVIKGIGSNEVARVADMMNVLRQHQTGEDVWLSIVRDGEEHAVRVSMAGRSQFPGSTATSEFRGFRGDFAGEAPDQARMNRFFEEHQRLVDRLDRLEAEVQALKTKLGAGAPEQNRRQERQPQREE